MLALNSSSAALTRQSFRNALSELHPRSGLGMLSGLFRIIVPIPRVETLGFYEADFVKTGPRKLFSFYFCFILADI
jgi:hypothetical protein